MRVTQAPLLDFYISKKIERRAPLRRRVIILMKIAVIIVLSTEKLKSIVFEDHDRISKMLWLCDPKSDPVQVFCILQNTCNWMGVRIRHL